MFGLFKKDLSDQELTGKLEDIILKIQLNILRRLVDNFDIENEEKLCREALFYSIWLFSKEFQATEIVRLAIGESIKTVAHEGLTEEIFHHYAKLSVERGKLYENIYESYFSKNNPMAIQMGFDSLFFGEQDFEGTNPENIPLNMMRGSLEAMTLSSLFLEFMEYDKEISKLKKKIFSKYVIESNKI
jgi:hypothetical protein